VTPAWTPDGASIVFASDREGGGFYLYRTDVATLETWRLEGTGADARSPEISRDGRSLVFVGYTADGYDVFRMALESARWTRATDSVFRAEPMGLQHGGEATVSSPSARTYTPWRTLAPRFWMPAIELDNDELVIGAATAAVDALGRHAYSVEAGWTTSRGRPDWQVAYAYDRWWPTLFANVIDDTDPWRDGEVRTKEANAGVLLPFRRVRWSQSLLGAFHVSTDTFRCSACGPRGEADVDRATIRAGWLVDAARSYGYSISLEDGWSASATTEFAREALGADGDGGAATLDVRGYLPVGPRHSVVAARIAGASSWGDERAARVFSASGNGPQPIRFDFDSDAIGLLRGLDDSDLLGRHAASVNLDYRFPLMRIERGAGTLPIFARVVHGALFVGAAHAWDTTFRGQDVRVAAGAELSLDAVIGYVLPVTFTTGAAWVSHDRGFAVFGRIGRAF
jgi:hypothetical protein